jgi:hypothetical protein
MITQQAMSMNQTIIAKQHDEAHFGVFRHQMSRGGTIQCLKQWDRTGVFFYEMNQLIECIVIVIVVVQGNVGRLPK